MTMAYNQNDSQKMERDKTIYRWSGEPGEYLSEPIEIKYKEEIVGKLYEVNNKESIGTTLYFEAVKNGEKIELWKYSDYRNLGKVTQSEDGDVLRIYHWHSFIFNRPYVTEFKIQTQSLKTYKISKKAYQKILNE